MAVQGSLERATPRDRVKARSDLLETVQILLGAKANPNILTKVYTESTCGVLVLNVTEWRDGFDTGCEG